MNDDSARRVYEAFSTTAAGKLAGLNSAAFVALCREVGLAAPTGVIDVHVLNAVHRKYKPLTSNTIDFEQFSQAMAEVMELAGAYGQGALAVMLSDEGSSPSGRNQQGGRSAPAYLNVYMKTLAAQQGRASQPGSPGQGSSSDGTHLPSIHDGSVGNGGGTGRRQSRNPNGSPLRNGPNKANGPISPTAAATETASPIPVPPMRTAKSLTNIPPMQQHDAPGPASHRDDASLAGERMERMIGRLGAQLEEQRRHRQADGGGPGQAAAIDALTRKLTLLESRVVKAETQLGERNFRFSELEARAKEAEAALAAQDARSAKLQARLEESEKAREALAASLQALARKVQQEALGGGGSSWSGPGSTGKAQDEGKSALDALHQKSRNLETKQLAVEERLEAAEVSLKGMREKLQAAETDAVAAAGVTAFSTKGANNLGRAFTALGDKIREGDKRHGESIAQLVSRFESLAAQQGQGPVRPHASSQQPSPSPQPVQRGAEAASPVPQAASPQAQHAGAGAGEEEEEGAGSHQGEEPEAEEGEGAGMEHEVEHDPDDDPDDDHDDMLAAAATIGGEEGEEGEV